MKNMTEQCKRRLLIAYYQCRINRLIRQAKRTASREVVTVPLVDRAMLRELTALIERRNRLRSPADIHQIEKKRGLA